MRDKTYPLVDSFAKSTFADVMQRRCDPMGPYEIVNVEAFLAAYCLFIRYGFLNHQHLKKGSSQYFSETGEKKVAT